MGTRRENSELANSTQATGGHWAVIMPGKRMSEVIRPTLITTTAYVSSDPVDVWKSSRVYIYATIVAAGAGGIASLVPEVSGGQTPGEADFFPLFDAADDGELDLPSVPSGEYVGTNFNSKTIRPQEFRNAASDGADTIKIGFFVDVLGARFFRVKVRSISGTPTVELKVFKVA